VPLLQLFREDCSQAFSQLDSERPIAEVVIELDLFFRMMTVAHAHIVTFFGIPVRCSRVVPAAARSQRVFIWRQQSFSLPIVVYFVRVSQSCACGFWGDDDDDDGGGGGWGGVGWGNEPI
jgi:hypothetical protein